MADWQEGTSTEVAQGCNLQNLWGVHWGFKYSGSETSDFQATKRSD